VKRKVETKTNVEMNTPVSEGFHAKFRESAEASIGAVEVIARCETVAAKGQSSTEVRTGTSPCEVQSPNGGQGEELDCSRAGVVFGVADINTESEGRVFIEDTDLGASRNNVVDGREGRCKQADAERSGRDFLGGS
jgi:hypothetical protein